MSNVSAALRPVILQEDQKLDPYTESDSAIIKGKGGDQYLDINRLNTNRSKELNSLYNFTSFYLFFLFFLGLATIIVCGIQYKRMKEGDEQSNKTWEQSLSYIIGVFTPLTVFILILIIFAPHRRAKAAINLVKAMSNTYAEDSTDDTVHDAMSTLLSAPGTDSQELTEYFRSKYANLVPNMMRASQGQDYSNAPGQRMLELNAARRRYYDNRYNANERSTSLGELPDAPTNQPGPAPESLPDVPTNQP
ncbi:MAG: hypothetical protein ACPGJP_05060 [Hyphomicrobiales bacterium]